MSKLVTPKKETVCPISHTACKLCTLYRARHYYTFPACREYERRLHIAAVLKQSGTKHERKTNADIG